MRIVDWALLIALTFQALAIAELNCENKTLLHRMNCTCPDTTLTGTVTNGTTEKTDAGVPWIHAPY
jgi:hypothetical protein